MIKIYDKMWVVKGYKNTVEDSKFLLSYMTYVDLTKSGEYSKAFLSRIDTGTSWSRQKGDKGTLTFENKPIKGVKVIGSVSRWSTSNKLIQIEDPRGFVVEIPTGNLTTLLKHTIVDKGVIKDECVWGREGNNHILLPVSSEVYKEAFDDTKLNNSKVSLTKLKIGEVVKFSVDSNLEYVYLGRGKAVWDVQTRKAVVEPHKYYSYNLYRTAPKTDEVLDEVKGIVDNKLCFLFKCTDKTVDSWDYIEYKTTGSAIVVGSTAEVNGEGITNIDIPERCKPNGWKNIYRLGKENRTYNTSRFVRVEMK